VLCAGITLLAFGNSSPDVFADLSAVQTNADFALAIGELMGASMFLTTVVLGAVVFVSTKNGQRCEVDPCSFVRDVLMLLAVVSFIFFVALSDHKITLLEAALLLLTYVVYVAAVVGSSYAFDDRRRFHRLSSMVRSPGAPPAKNRPKAQTPLLFISRARWAHDSTRLQRKIGIIVPLAVRAKLAAPQHRHARDAEPGHGGHGAGRRRAGPPNVSARHA
jgi:Ca2+/Na+ antiporter